MSVELENGEALLYRTVIIATGVRRKQLGVAGESESRGKRILESGARDKELAIGKRVLIIAGGDAAIENVLLLSGVAASVKAA